MLFLDVFVLQSIRPPEHSSPHRTQIFNASSFQFVGTMKVALASLFLLVVPSLAVPLIPPAHQLSHANLAVRPVVPESGVINPGKLHQTATSSLIVEDPDKVAYFSSPLRGTETRDRQILALSRVEQHSNPISNGPSQVPQQKIDKYHSSALLDINHQAKPNEIPPNIVKTEKQPQAKLKVSNATIAENYHVAPGPKESSPHTSLKGFSFRGTSPKEIIPADLYAEKKGKSFIKWLRRVMRTTADYGASFVHDMKLGLAGLRSGRKSSETAVSHQERADGYSEEDVVNLVNDIISEIQMRSDEVRDHAQMLKKTNRWELNNDEKGDKPIEVKDEPKLYMRTKMVVSPETVVDAVIANVKKIFLSQHPQLPWNERSKLLREVQARLSEVLTTAK